MSEPIKLPPADVMRLVAWHEAMAAEPNRNEAKRDKHRGTASELLRLLAVEQNTATLRAECDALRSDLATLRAENYETQSLLAGAETECDALRRHVELLKSKVDAEKSCACAYDNPDEVCLPHSPLVEALRAECDAKSDATQRLRNQRDALLDERDALRAALKDIADDYEDRFDMDDPSTNPGMKHVVRAARDALKEAK